MNLEVKVSVKLGEIAIVGPADHVILRVRPGVDIDRVREDLKVFWPDLQERILVVATDIDVLVLRAALDEGYKNGLEACPECRAGKHDSCNGDTWNWGQDRAAPCPCATARHGKAGETNG